MGNSNLDTNTAELLEDILEFADHTEGLDCSVDESAEVHVHQRLDGKSLRFLAKDLEDILHRFDGEGKKFIQLNFVDGRKLLLTETLIGFKPCETLGLDMNKLPKVVTTPDLRSVFEAIEEVLNSEVSSEHEVEILKRVYWSILHGAETAGFELLRERVWLERLSGSRFKASA